jgi:glycosyltransferase involved in cell wall biosynthesis
MQILYLNPSGGLGGAETSLLTLLSGLREIRPDWRLRLIAGEQGPLVERAAALGVEAVAMALPGKLARTGDAGRSGTLAAKVARYGRGVAAGVQAAQYRRELAAVIRRLSPDLVHTNGFKMHILGAWSTPRQTPLIVHLHDYVTTRPLASRLLKAGIHSCAAVATNSKSVEVDARRLLGSTKPIIPIYNAVDANRFTPEGPATDLDARCGLAPAGPDTVRVGLIATFAHWKGHRTFLGALSLLPRGLPVRGYIIGGPIYRTSGSQHSFEELREQIRVLGLTDRVGLTGFLEEPPPALRALDIVVHASSAPEPFGMVIIEAMACERAVIASNAGGAMEIFEDGVTALGHTPGDAAHLAIQIQRLAASPELRARLGAAGRRAMLAQFQPERMAQEFATLYSDTRDRFVSQAESRRGFRWISPSRDGAAS